MGLRRGLTVALFLLISVSIHAQNPAASDTTTANQLFEKADSLKNIGDFDNSTEYFTQASAIFQQNERWLKYVRCLNRISENYWRQGKFDLSMEKATLALHESIARIGAGNMEQATAYENMGVINDEKGNSKASLQYYQKALAIQLKKVGEFHPDVANTYNNLAILMNNMDNDREALLYHEKCITIYEKLYGETSIKMANTLNNIGGIYLKESNYKEALKYFKRSLDMKGKVPVNNPLLLADSYDNLGLAYSNMGEYKASLENFGKALAIRKKILGSYHYTVANTYSNMSVAYYHLGNYDRALENYEKALLIEKQAFGEKSSAVALEYMRMGIVYVDKGAYDLGLEYYQRALGITEQLNVGREQRDIAVIYSNMGVAWLYKEGYSQALDFFQKALAIQIGKVGELTTDVAITYNNLGEVHLATNDYRSALHFFERSLSIKRHIYGERSYLVANTYANMARAFQGINDHAQSLTYYRKALKIDHELYGKKNPYLANIYTDLAKTYLDQKDFPEALAACQQALIANVVNFSDTTFLANPKLADYMNGFYLFSSLKLKGEILVQLYENSRAPSDLESALTVFQLCDSLLNKIRDEQQKNEDKISLSTVGLAIYQQAVKACYTLFSITGKEPYLKKAFYFSEQSKSAVLKQAVADNSARNFGGIPDSLQSMEKELKIDRVYYQSQVLSEQARNSLDAEKLEAFRSGLFRTNRKYDSLVNVLEKHYPKYFQLKYKDESTTVETLQNSLPNISTAMIEYFLTDSTIYTFIITKNQFKVLKTSLDKNFNRSLLAFRKKLDAGALLKNPQQVYQEFTSTSQYLYGQLFASAHALLTNSVTRLVIIPHGILSYVPFGILAPDGPAKNIDYRNLHYLIKDYDISYAYSGSLWLQGSLEPPASNWKNQFAGFAPSYPADLLAQSSALAKYGNYRDKITNLAFTDTEIENASKYFSGIIFTGKQATETAFKTQAPHDRILHLAMHAIVDEKNPLDSKLIFYHAGDSTDDGFLNAYELYNMDLHADMAVLSACNTGYGKLAQGEGVMSLSRAFSYAGCRSLVMSLWEANDKSTAEIMRLFYKNLSAGDTKDDALRQAKLRFLEQSDPLTSHPFFWGGFIVNGNVNPIAGTHYLLSVGWWIIVAAVLLFLSFIIYALYQKKRRERHLAD